VRQITEMFQGPICLSKSDRCVLVQKKNSFSLGVCKVC